MISPCPVDPPPHVEKIVLDLKYKHCKTWRDKPDWYWFMQLMEEVFELALSLLGLHRHGPDIELAQIASIAMNFMEKRKLL